MLTYNKKSTFHKSAERNSNTKERPRSNTIDYCSTGSTDRVALNDRCNTETVETPTARGNCSHMFSLQSIQNTSGRAGHGGNDTPLSLSLAAFSNPVSRHTRLPKQLVYNIFYF